MKVVADRKRKGKGKFKYLLFDLPSDHEIVGSLVTECAQISTMLANQQKAGVTKLIKFVQPNSLRRVNQYPYEPMFVHVAGHGSDEGLSMLGKILPWGEVAKSLTNYVKPLADGQQRILSFSCCKSAAGVRLCADPLRQHFTGAYFFSTPKISFATALVVWNMFYWAEPNMDNHQRIVERINTFIGSNVLQFMPYPISMLNELELIERQVC